ncbi:hypothetical protein HELRODRAFT_179115 [Helobdella robusta]|uniref:Uncharacterized protein n=1 Tax=Helobdella robusta TaxID=6412 RepID=T1FE65_HELRO|nr:hypothetical protein HELRODRAFT_179115 [Helobdella robusta]ESN95645.1 hypothetical protein HELRODRAFT_179115 [Helobdella robusta]
MTPGNSMIENLISRLSHRNESYEESSSSEAVMKHFSTSAAYVAAVTFFRSRRILNLWGDLVLITVWLKCPPPGNYQYQTPCHDTHGSYKPATTCHLPVHQRHAIKLSCRFIMHKPYCDLTSTRILAPPVEQSVKSRSWWCFAIQVASAREQDMEIYGKRKGHEQLDEQLYFTLKALLER